MTGRMRQPFLDGVGELLTTRRPEIEAAVRDDGTADGMHRHLIQAVQGAARGLFVLTHPVK